MNKNLILRILPSGPYWPEVAVVACRLANSAPLESNVEHSWAGSDTNPVSQGSVVEKALRSLKSISAQNFSTSLMSTGHWIPCSRPQDRYLASPSLVVWLLVILECGALGFLYFIFRDGGGSAPCSTRVGILSAQLPSSRIVFLILSAAPPCFWG